MSILKTENLVMQFGGLTAVNNLSLDIKEREIVSVIGPNGGGKTTAFNMITGVYTPTQGKVLLNGKDITGRRPDEINKLGIARTFQNIRLFKDLSVLDNVLIGNHLHVESNVLGAIFKLPKYRREEKEMREKSLALLEEFGLLEYKDDKASSLPYGQQRRLEIARALATNPKLLVLDEPAAGMNPKESDDLTHFIRQIRDKYNLSVLLIEHYMDLVMEISDRIYVLEFGETIAHGTPSEIQNNPAVIEAYLGVEEDA